MDPNDALDDKDSGPEVQLNLPSSVMSRIEELMGGTEQFDSDDFDAVAYINRMFPTEQSLAGVESAAARCEYRLAGARGDATRLLRAQHAQRAAGHQALLQASACIADLAHQVADINKKAERSEAMVREITAEMKQLDRAKWNLTAAITALNQLHLLAGGAAALRTLAAARKYRDLPPPLQATEEVLQRLDAYKDIQQLSTLREEVLEIRSQLAKQILSDFKEAFTGAGKGGVSQRQLAEACAVVDVLEPRVKRELLKWLVDVQLQEYEHLFGAEQECAWLAHVERRYAWLKKHLLAFEDARALAFPHAWRLSERIAHRFCTMTREMLSAQLAARRGELDVKLLLYAIQKTYNFELLLHKRFVGTEPGTEAADSKPDKEISFDDDNNTVAVEGAVSGGGAGAGGGGGGGGGIGGEGEAGSSWVGLIGSCFEPHLSLYITSLDAHLRSLMDRFVQDAKAAEAGGGAGGGGAGGGGGGGVEAGSGAVLASCAELFLFYKKCLAQCARLTTGEPMLELAGVFQKYLREYASGVLQAALPRAPAAPLALHLHTLHSLHTLLRDDAHATRYTKQEIAKIASVMTTAEYCLETTVHLEQKLREKVSGELAARVELAGELELFHGLLEECARLLVRDLELGCEPALQAMQRVPWLQLQAVGDQSSYVTQIVMHLTNTVPVVRDHLASSRKYFTQFCIRFASSFIPKLIASVYKCKPVSAAGAEQLLLDAHTLKTALLQLPSLGSDVRRPPPTTYAKVVIKLMTKLEMILKLVMAPMEGPDAFAAQVVQLLPDATVADLNKLLDMKAARAPRAPIVAAFQKLRDPTTTTTTAADTTTAGV